MMAEDRYNTKNGRTLKSAEIRMTFDAKKAFCNFNFLDKGKDNSAQYRLLHH